MTADEVAAEPMPLPAAVRRLLAGNGLDRGPVLFAAPSATRADTGGWLRGGRLWAVVVGDRLALVAAGPRPTLIQLPVATLSRAVYNHVTGALTFPTGSAGPAVQPLRFDPLVARSLMALASAPIAPTPPSGTFSHA